MEKRDRPSWPEFFMFNAWWVATKSSCKYLQTGAVIVKDKRIIAAGYNGAPSGNKNCLEVGCRKEQQGIDFETKGTGNCRGIHAELNAMIQIARKNLANATMYSLYYPCSGCAKIIAGNDISKVFYSKIYKEPDSLTKEIFEEKKIKVEKLELDVEKYFDMIRNIDK